MVRLSISREKGLIVTIPRGFRAEWLPPILQEKQDWIQKAYKKVLEAEPSPPKKSLPESLDLAALNEKWQVIYKPLDRKTTSLEVQSGRILLIQGRVNSLTTIRSLLRKWLRTRAEQVLPAWLDRISHQTGLRYQDVTIRDQRTRWGSCSSQKNINLNQKLLLLPPTLVDYIMVHELCHTLQMSHSAKFWKLVGQFMPDYALRRKQLREFEKKIIW